MVGQSIAQRAEIAALVVDDRYRKFVHCFAEDPLRQNLHARRERGLRRADDLAKVLRRTDDAGLAHRKSPRALIPAEEESVEQVRVLGHGPFH